MSYIFFSFYGTYFSNYVNTEFVVNIPLELYSYFVYYFPTLYENGESREMLQEAVVASLWFYLGISLERLRNSKETSVTAVDAQLRFRSIAS
jgi:hypothetical protein